MKTMASVKAKYSSINRGIDLEIQMGVLGYHLRALWRGTWSSGLGSHYSVVIPRSDWSSNERGGGHNRDRCYLQVKSNALTLTLYLSQLTIMASPAESKFYEVPAMRVNHSVGRKYLLDCIREFFKEGASVDSLVGMGGKAPRTEMKPIQYYN